MGFRDQIECALAEHRQELLRTGQVVVERPTDQAGRRLRVGHRIRYSPHPAIQIAGEVTAVIPGTPRHPLGGVRFTDFATRAHRQARAEHLKVMDGKTEAQREYRLDQAAAEAGDRR